MRSPLVGDRTELQPKVIDWHSFENFPFSVYTAGCVNHIPTMVSDLNTGRTQRHNSLQYNEPHLGWTNFLDAKTNEDFLHARNQKRLGSWAGVESG